MDEKEYEKIIQGTPDEIITKLKELNKEELKYVEQRTEADASLAAGILRRVKQGLELDEAIIDELSGNLGGESS